jgi:hypothetical protein
MESNFSLWSLVFYATKYFKNFCTPLILKAKKIVLSGLRYVRFYVIAQVELTDYPISFL